MTKIGRYCTYLSVSACASVRLHVHCQAFVRTLIVSVGLA